VLLLNFLCELKDSQHYCGPLPPPEILEKFELVQPGFADRIMSLAEKQAEHRQTQENKISSSNIRNELIGMIFAFLLAAGVLGGGMFLLFQGKNISGLITITGSLASLVYVFIRGRKEQRKERKKKAKRLSRKISGI